MSRKRNKGLDRRGWLMMLMWMSIWLGGSLWSGLHGGNGVLTAVWHGFLTMAGCMGVFLLIFLITLMPEEQRRYNERKRREIEKKKKEYDIWKEDNPGNYDYTPPKQKDDIFGNI